MTQEYRFVQFSNRSDRWLPGGAEWGKAISLSHANNNDGLDSERSGSGAQRSQVEDPASRTRYGTPLHSTNSIYHSWTSRFCPKDFAINCFKWFARRRNACRLIMIHPCSNEEKRWVYWRHTVLTTNCECRTSAPHTSHNHGNRVLHNPHPRETLTRSSSQCQK